MTNSDSSVGSEDPFAFSPPRGGLREQPSLLMPEAVLYGLADELAHRFAGVFSIETVERYVFESYVALERTARITSHLPTLT